MQLPAKLPVHISIIMDGNGRWAKERGQQRAFGHAEGIESVRAITEACAEWGIPYLSLFAFSEENWGRPQEEVDALMKLMFKAVAGEYETMMRNNVRFVVLGNRARLDPVLNEAVKQLEDSTAGNTGLTMIVFVSYSGKWDIQQAADRMAAEGGSSIEPYLVTAGFPDPDLIIRTSGEQRLSNYLLWQGAYSEFYFTKVLWPDFDRAQMKLAIEEYASRDRRYGKVK